MKILMTSDTVSGIWNHSLQLAAELEPHGVEILLAALGPAPHQCQIDEARKIPNLRLVHGNYKLEWMDNPWDDIARADSWLLDLEQHACPDVIHLNHYAHGNLPWNASVLIVAHTCVLGWWEAIKGNPAPESWNRYRSLVSQSLRAAQLVITPTRARAAEIQRFYGPLTNTQVILNGRNANGFFPLDKERFILSAGQFTDETRNIAALQSIAEDIPWPILVAGDNRDLDGQLQPPHGIQTLSLNPDQFADKLAHCPIFALPARYEPIGLTILEAALSACALILGDIPALREIWDGIALFVHPDDTDELRSSINSLIDRWPLRQWLGARARNRALQHHSRRMASSYLSAYRRLAANAHSMSPSLRQ
jgi:glycogen(starch) synthase